MNGPKVRFKKKTSSNSTEDSATSSLQEMRSHPQRTLGLGYQDGGDGFKNRLTKHITCVIQYNSDQWMSDCRLRIAHAHCLQFERSGMVLMSHIREASKITVNSSYFHPAHQHYTG